MTRLIFATGFVAVLLNSVQASQAQEVVIGPPVVVSQQVVEPPTVVTPPQTIVVPPLAPVTVYRPSYVSPPVIGYRPIVESYPAYSYPVYVAPVRQFVPGQPIRNFFRAIAP